MLPFAHDDTQLDLNVVIREWDVSARGMIAVHTPDDADKPMGLDINYDSLAVSRLGQSEAFLQRDSLNLQYRGSSLIAPDPGMSIKELFSDERGIERRKSSALNLLVQDASVLNMSVLNYYLPPDMPFSFTGGSANLDADVFLDATDMKGSIKLDSSDVKVTLDDQNFEADLAADINIKGGMPLELTADISGSSLLMDKVSVDGEHESFDGDYWSTLLELTDVEGVFQKPLKFSAKADLSVSDTRPLVAMFDNRSDPPRWVSKLMTVKELNCKRDLDVIKVRAKFDRYQLPSINRGLQCQSVSAMSTQCAIAVTLWSA